MFMIQMMVGSNILTSTLPTKQDQAQEPFDMSVNWDKTAMKDELGQKLIGKDDV